MRYGTSLLLVASTQKFLLSCLVSLPSYVRGEERHDNCRLHLAEVDTVALPRGQAVRVLLRR